MNSEAWDVQNIKEHQRSTIFQQNRIFLSTPPQRSAQDLQAENSYTLQFQDSIQGWTWVEFVWLPVSCILSSGNIYIYTSYMSLISPISWQASDYTCHPKIGIHRLYKSQKLSKISLFFLPAFFSAKKKQLPLSPHTQILPRICKSFSESKSNTFGSWNLRLSSPLDGFQCETTPEKVTRFTHLAIWLWKPPKRKRSFLNIKFQVRAVSFRSTNVWILFWWFWWYWHVLDSMSFYNYLLHSTSIDMPSLFHHRSSVHTNRPT